MRRYISCLMRRLGFAADAVAAFETAYIKICGNEKSACIFKACIRKYEETENAVYDTVYEDAVKIESACGVDKYTVMMLFMLGFTRQLKVIYDRHGYSAEMYFDILKDLVCKTNECRTIKGVYGSFVSEWEFKIFNLKLFAFGRLQFEPSSLACDYSVSTGVLKQGTDALSIHIPSCGRLDTELCVDSVKSAQRFFAGTGYKIFYCHSWLLYPDNRKIIAPPSNILKFMDLFEIVSVQESADDLWRVFGTEDISDIKSLPEDTSLRRGFKKWLLSGNKVGRATGFITDRGLQE